MKCSNPLILQEVEDRGGSVGHLLPNHTADARGGVGRERWATLLGYIKFGKDFLRRSTTLSKALILGVPSESSPGSQQRASCPARAVLLCG